MKSYFIVVNVSEGYATRETKQMTNDEKDKLISKLESEKKNGEILGYVISQPKWLTSRKQ